MSAPGVTSPGPPPGVLRRFGPSVRRGGRPAGWLVMTAVVVAFTWPINPLLPGSGGYDISWITGLVVAAHGGLHWGSQIDYTYGPLGWLTIGNVFYTVRGLIADLAIAVLYFSVLALIARTVSRALGLGVATLVVFTLARVAAGPLDPVELMAPLMVALGVSVLQRDAPLSDREAGGLGLLVAVSSLDKLSVAPVGLAVLLVLAIDAALASGVSGWRQRARIGALLLGAFVGSLLTLWLLLGQSLFDLPGYVRNGWELINGYSDGEGLSAPSLNWQYGWATVCAVALLAGAIWNGRGLPRRRQIGILVLWIWFLYTEFRHAFVRLAPGHAGLFFEPALLLAALVLIAPGRWRVGLAATLVALAGAWHIGTWNVMNLFAVSSGGLETQVNILLSANTRAASRAASRADLRSGYHFPPALVRAMTGQTVHFDPWEATLAWAYPQVRWDPAPIFQSYNAYTSYLDNVNAGFLAGPRAPTYVLRQNVTNDLRNPRFESPRYVLALICRYHEVMTAVGWQLLERGPNRCGKPVAAGRERVRFDQRISPPPPTPDSIVVGSFTDFSSSLLDTLRAALFRSPPQYIELNQTIFRFVQGSASNPHVLSVPDCLDYNPALFDSAPYRTLAIGHEPQLGRPGASEPSTYTVSFERVPFNCTG